VAEHPRSGDNVDAALAARPELAKLAEPDFIAETYLAGQARPISVAAAEGLLDGDAPGQWHETGRRRQGERGRLSGRRGKPMSAAPLS
jgi:hypothetical protein